MFKSNTITSAFLAFETNMVRTNVRTDNRHLHQTQAATVTLHHTVPRWNFFPLFNNSVCVSPLNLWI